MNNLAILLLLVSLAALGRAHVRLHYTPAMLPIRNAGGPESDGRMSVNGPCGGTQAFGANGVGQLNNGQKVSVRINYNGGHKSSNNEFSAHVLCGRPTSADFRSAEPITLISEETDPAPKNTGTHVDSSIGNQQQGGYTLTFKMPTMDLSESDECSISIKDQRNWGGCVDFKLVEPVVTRAPRPTVPPRVLELSSLSGSYPLSECLINLDGCCCVNGSVAVMGEEAVLDLVPGEEGTRCAAVQESVSLTRAEDSTNTFVGRTNMAGQAFEVTVRSGQVSLVNVGPDQPTQCDSLAAFRPGAASSSASTAGIVVGVLFAIIVVAVVAFFLMRRGSATSSGRATLSKEPRHYEGHSEFTGNPMFKKKPEVVRGAAPSRPPQPKAAPTRPPQPKAAPVRPPMPASKPVIAAKPAVRPKPASRPPPPRPAPRRVEWQELVDDDSGDRYYFNQATGETTWDRPAGAIKAWDSEC